MAINQNKIIKIIRLGLIIIIAVFLAISIYNSTTKEEKRIIVSNSENSCKGCPNQHQCNNRNIEKSCSEIELKETGNCLGEN